MNSKITWVVLILWAWLAILLWQQDSNKITSAKISADFGYTCAIAGMDRGAMHKELEKSINGR